MRMPWTKKPSPEKVIIKDPNVKYCEDCVHYIKSDLAAQYSKCNYGNVVSYSEPVGSNYCTHQREYDLDRNCGKDGAHFKPRNCC